MRRLWRDLVTHLRFVRMVWREHRIHRAWVRLCDLTNHQGTGVVCATYDEFHDAMVRIHTKDAA